MSPFFVVTIDTHGQPLFSLGRVVATPGALDLLDTTQTVPAVLLARHVTGDWGDCDPRDKQSNQEALVQGLRIMSVYRLPLVQGGRPDQPVKDLAVDLSERTIWIITEADRSITTLLLPIEY